MYFIPTYVRREDIGLKSLRFPSKYRLFPETHRYIHDKTDPILLVPKMVIVPVMENDYDISNWLSL